MQSLRLAPKILPFRRLDPLSLLTFVKYFEKGHFERAAKVAADIFLLGDDLSKELVRRFQYRRAADRLVIHRLLELEVSMKWADLEEATEILEEAFGVRGMDAIWMIQAFQETRSKTTYSMTLN